MEKILKILAAIAAAATLAATLVTEFISITKKYKTNVQTDTTNTDKPKN